MLIPVIATLVVAAGSLLALTLRGRPMPLRDARDRLIARNPMLGDAQLTWRTDYVSHRRPATWSTDATRARLTRLAVATTLLLGTYCDRRPATDVPAWYDR